MPRVDSWFDWLLRLAAEEFAPRPRRIGTALRFAIIASVATGLMAICQVDSPLGPYLIWLLLGAVPMMSLATALGFLAIEGSILALSVLLAGILDETPWLMLPAIGAFIYAVTYANTLWKLGALGLVVEVVTLDTFYGVIFAPDNFGWAAAALYGGSVLALLVLAAFDGWLWPAPAETILIESLAASDERMRGRLLNATRYYLADGSAERPSNPPASSESPAQLALLDRAVAEGITPDRRAILLAAITRAARVHIEIDRLVIAARESTPRYVRGLLRPEIENAAEAIAATLDELAREGVVRIRTGPDEPPSPVAARVRPALEALDARIVEVRPTYIGKASVVELANLGAVGESLRAMAQLLERPLDTPPASVVRLRRRIALPSLAAPDPALARYCAKVALCIVVGYVVGLISHRPELSVILTTIVITALPTYGASLRKMILRIVGTAAGGVIVILTIIIVTPNFETLPSYMLAVFMVLFVSAYAALASGRTAYAGKSIGTTFLLVFAGLSPSRDIYGPLWRLWGIGIGTVIVTIVFFLLWPEYAGDSLLPRLRKVLRDTLAIAPRGAAAADEAAIHGTSTEITRLLSEMLEVADDARLEGRMSLINHDAVVQAAGTLRRIAHRLGAIASARISDPMPRLDEAAEALREAVLAAICARLGAWLTFYESPSCLSSRAALAHAAGHSRDQVARPLELFGSCLEADGFVRLAGWTLAQRRQLLAELQSLRRLEFLMVELDRYIAQVPGAAPSPAVSVSLQTSRP
jgi:uncharacterized membrane protein YccC